MSTNSRYIRGALAFFGTHRKRLLNAIGENVVSYIEDFVNLPVDDTTGDPLAWTTTVVEAGSGTTTFASTDASGGKSPGLGGVLLIFNNHRTMIPKIFNNHRFIFFVLSYNYFD